MLTVNAGEHALMKHTHGLDSKRPPEMQDNRMVVILQDCLCEAWLDSPVSKSKGAHDVAINNTDQVLAWPRTHRSPGFGVFTFHLVRARTARACA
jgi:hypothetical protein